MIPVYKAGMVKDKKNRKDLNCKRASKQIKPCNRMHSANMSHLSKATSNLEQNLLNQSKGQLFRPTKIIHWAGRAQAIKY